MSTSLSKPASSLRRRSGVRAIANSPPSRCRTPKNGFPNTAFFGSELSTLSNATSANQTSQKSQKRRRIKNGHATIAAAKRDPAKTHLRRTSRTRFPCLDRRQGVRALVSPNDRTHHGHHASGSEGGR